MSPPAALIAPSRALFWTMSTNSSASGPLLNSQTPPPSPLRETVPLALAPSVALKSLMSMPPEAPSLPSRPRFAPPESVTRSVPSESFSRRILTSPPPLTENAVMLALIWPELSLMTHGSVGSPRASAQPALPVPPPTFATWASIWQPIWWPMPGAAVKIALNSATTMTIRPRYSAEV